ncbi:MAG: calcium-binding protein [Hymenobacteraceae bacterium]|nr:calcium-binding protein [Hymenobacteraceae bacterium]
MSLPPVDPIREERITMEIIVDAYDESERALGWYYYLQDTLQFPFRAACAEKLAKSPVRVGQQVTVIGMPDEAECEDEMFVYVRWPPEPGEPADAAEDDDGLAVPLRQLQPLAEVDEETTEAVADWHYWVRQGYSF